MYACCAFSIAKKQGAFDFFIKLAKDMVQSVAEEYSCGVYIC
jgi:hypothetical protein